MDKYYLKSIISSGAQSSYPNKLIRACFGLLISILLIIYLSSFIKFNIFYSMISSIRSDLALVASLIYFSTYLPRAYRFQLLLAERRIFFPQHLCVVGIHAFLNHVLPFRTGELSYLYLRKKYHDISYQEATANLLTIRIYDVISLGFWILALSPFVIHQLRIFPAWEKHQFLLNLSGIAIFLIAISLCWYLFVNGKSSFLHRVIVFLSSEEDPGDSFHKKMFRFAGEVFSKALVEIAPKTHIRLFGASMLVWGLLFIYFYLIFCSLLPEISFLESLIPSLGAIVGNLLPVNGIGSFGTFDAGLVIGQSGLGISRDVSVPVAFLIHAHAILSGCVSAVISWLALRNGKNNFLQTGYNFD